MISYHKIHCSSFTNDYEALGNFPNYDTHNFPSLPYTIWVYQKFLPLEEAKVILTHVISPSILIKPAKLPNLRHFLGDRGILHSS